MESDKPFKTVEVMDSRTGQVCKVACMSCIRGHRTTSCGIPVCRTKVFWTVKRPGRPSNTCTCRFGGTGRCQCAVAKSACPHKPKKGEKRSVECRCDEQGRYCCLLESEHWEALFSLQKPRVNFFSSREDLEASQKTPTVPHFPPTPANSASTPGTVLSTPGTPSSNGSIQPAQVQSPQWSNIQSPDFQPPRFGMMGIGLPLGSEGHEGKDVLVWNDHAPEAPREYHSYASLDSLEITNEPTTLSSTQRLSTAYQQSQTGDAPYQNPDFAPVSQSFQDMTLVSQDQAPEVFDFDKLMTDYFNYQFPSAICQNCGMNGCTCRNCPAVMQSFQSGSWAQCCSRKHTQGPHAPPSRTLATQGTMINGLHHSNDMQLDISSDADHTFVTNFNPDGFKMPDGSDPMDLSEFLINDLEQPSPKPGCCCGD